MTALGRVGWSMREETRRPSGLPAAPGKNHRHSVDWLFASFPMASVRLWAMDAYDELVDVIATRPAAERIIGFRASEENQCRVADLLEREKEGFADAARDARTGSLSSA